MTESASSSSSSPPNFSAESLNGLKFGRKIYFEDGGLGALHKSSSGSAAGSSSAGATPPKKQRGGGNWVSRRGIRWRAARGIPIAHYILQFQVFEELQSLVLGGVLCVLAVIVSHLTSVSALGLDGGFAFR
ncbi:hypothetical protein ACFX11_008910 [Malus domestica]